MSDEKKAHRGEFDDLEPLRDVDGLEELDELEELEELDELDELEELAELEELEPIPAAAPAPPPPRPAPIAAPRPAPPPPTPVTPAASREAEPAPPPVAPAASAAPTPPAAVPPVRSTAPDPEPAPAPAPGSDAPQPGSASVATGPVGAPSEPVAAAAPPAPAPAPPAGRPAPGQVRELDRAPILLRKAALILLVGSIVPWGDARNPELSTGLLWGGSIAEKLVLYVAVWFFYQSHVLKHGGQVPSPFGALKPLGLMILAGAVALVGLYWPVTGMFLFPTLGEKILLLLGGFTWIHIYDYERGGKFNPIFPLLFLGAAITGLATIFEVVNDGPPGLLALLVGTIPVTVAGFIAMYTMGVALKQAKTEGDQKKEAALAARRAARADRKPAAGGGESDRPGAGGGSGAVVRRRDRT